MALAAVSRQPRILWACRYCLLDTTSGASISVREMLKGLFSRSYDVAIAGATVFDHPTGNFRLKEIWNPLQEKKGEAVFITDADGLHHRLLITNSTQESEMTFAEISRWHELYCAGLDTFKPDLVFFYGGHPVDYLIGVEARARGIPVAAYLVNGNYSGSRWCQDVDLIITDSKATASLYQQQESYRIIPVGKFINPSLVVAEHHTRQHLLLVNPTMEKGAGLVVQLALMLETERPDITFEVVESRGKWADIVKMVSRTLGKPRDSLANVTVTPNTDDMRPLYGRARMLLAPSLWWESGVRVVVEAMMNGIPALITNRGGTPEMMQDGGIILNLSQDLHEAPYNRLPKEAVLRPVVDTLIRIYDDEAFYADLVGKACRVRHTHSIDHNIQRLIQAITPLLDRRAGDQDFQGLLKQVHKQGLG